MSFSTFLLYFLLSIIVLVIGYIVIGLLGRTVLSGSDTVSNAKVRRGTAKWERVEAELEDN